MHEPPFVLKQLTSELFATHPVEQHCLFRLLDGDLLSDPEARAIALDIFHVVDAFPRFLAALLANIDDYRARMTLVDNLYSEHGRLQPAHVHVVTYRAYLHALGLDDAAIDESRPGVGPLAYVRALLALCGREAPAEALGALGVIEEIVARVSPSVGRYGRRKQADGRGVGSHFSVHEALDLSHADEIYELAAAFCERGSRALVLRGIELGFYYQTRLYTDLVATRVAPATLTRLAIPDQPTYLDLAASTRSPARDAAAQAARAK